MIELSPTLLDELVASLTRQGAPVVSQLRPGLRDEAMVQLAEGVGLKLPDEARLWWGWHDGAEAPNRVSECLIGPFWRFRPLEEAVETCRTMRHISAENQLTDQDFWRDEWLPLLTGEIELVCDCSVLPGEPTPVRAHDIKSGIWEHEPELPSFGTVVAGWISALDRGIWTWRSDLGRWEVYEPELMPMPR